MIASSSHNAYTRGTGTAVCARERITRYSAVDCVSAWQQMAKGLAPQNISSGGGGELVSRVGLAALEPLGSKRAAEPVEVIAHPPFEPTEWQIIPFPTDCCPTSGNPSVADSHLAPYKPALPTVDCIWGTGQAAPSIVTLEAQRGAFRSIQA